MNDTALAIPGRVSEIGLDLEAVDLDYDAWERAGQLLGQIGRASSWWAGDWLTYGERHFGEQYAQGVSVLGYSNNTIRNWQWVCERVPINRRVSALGFAHHQAVAALEPDEQDAMLADAWANGWSVAELKRQIKGDPDPVPEPEIGDRNTCPHCRKPIRDWLLDHCWRDADDG